MDKLTKIFETLNIDGLLLTDYYNKRYFTGFTGSAGIALVTKNGKYFVSDSRYSIQATEQVLILVSLFLKTMQEVISN